MIKTSAKIARYKTESYYVDIVETEDEFEAWLVKEGYGISLLMFGICKQDLHRPFFDIVADNVGDYIDSYEQKYC